MGDFFFNFNRLRLEWFSKLNSGASFNKRCAHLCANRFGGFFVFAPTIQAFLWHIKGFNVRQVKMSKIYSIVLFVWVCGQDILLATISDIENAKMCVPLFGDKWSFDTIFSSYMTDNNFCFYFKQCQIVARVVACAQLW